ncbi:methyltransferase type 12 [Pseudomonas alcaligenes]|uniref:Methyltransferase type 12 n=1 Tax=Aquipseudomonas alcaligenes TaxID=43263 RepID=A0ABR7RZA8_AQUAC|nr:class I SAM-dependent methyltransferase [Pseudomonas alcaligenes]MBC9250129.1 methyltransferase type 12 [Pseudomonas alcaligenes]
MPDRLWQRGMACDSGQCRLCGATLGQRHFWPEVYANSGQQLRRCGYCAGVYLAPGFTEQGLDEFYAERYRQLFPAEIPWLSLERFFSWRGDRTVAQQRLQLIAPQLAHGDGLFELGSGFGAFLGAASAQRPDLRLLASEPDVSHRDALLEGAQVHFVAGLDSLEAESLEALVAFHTLEHVTDPLATLDLAARALRPDGQLWLEVPDLFGNWTSRLFVHPAHLSYFCQESLRNLVQAAGFEVLSCGAHPLPSMHGNLWLHARRPATLLQRPLHAEREQTIAAIDTRIMRVDWRLRDSLKALAKRTAIRLLGAGAVGEWQRWRHRYSGGESQK